MKYLKFTVKPGLAFALVVISFSLLLCTCQLIVYQGDYADATHTAGGSTLSDILLLTNLLAIAPLSIYLFLKNFVSANLAEDDKEALQSLKRFGIGTLAFAEGAIIFFPFILPAAACGVIALALSFSSKNKRRKGITIYRLANILAIAISGVSTYLVFH